MRTQRVSLVTSNAGLVAAVFVISFVVRAASAVASPTPTFFPDEYIYGAIGRSLGSDGRPLIRDQVARFPALLEPLLAAPLWRFLPTSTAYHLVQVENALFMSLAVFPAYLLARRLDLGRAFALVCAAGAVALPDLSFANYVLADPVAYPLVLAALYTGVCALERPRPRLQLLFLGFAGLATAARVQYVVLLPAFLLAAVAVDGRSARRSQRLPLCAVALLAGLSLAVGPSRVLGYYAAIGNLHIGLGLLQWAALDVLFLAVAGGIVLVPGAVVGFATPRSRGEKAFTALVVTYAVLLLVEAGAYASNGSARFQERYLFTLLPLIPVAFCLYLRRGRPGRLVVLAAAAMLVALTARLPLAGYAAGTGSTDSPLLSALLFAQRHLGVAGASSLVAAYAALAGAFAVGVAWRGGGGVALIVAGAFFISVSVAATSSAIDESRFVARQYLTSTPSWIDDAGVVDVTAVQTPYGPPAALTEQLFWNRSVQREVVLANATPTDAFRAPPLSAGRDGSLRTADGPLGQTILFQDYAATARFSNARLLARRGTFSLWQASGVPTLRSLLIGRFSDGWLAPQGTLKIWPLSGRRVLRARVTLTLSLPRGRPATTVTFGHRRVEVRGGHSSSIRFSVERVGPWAIAFKVDRSFYTEDLRPVAVQASAPVVAERRAVPARRSPASGIARGAGLAKVSG